MPKKHPTKKKMEVGPKRPEQKKIGTPTQGKKKKQKTNPAHQDK